MRIDSRGALAGAMILACIGAALAGTNTWTETGPLASDVKVRFSAGPDVAYARGGDKLWKTTDGGQTWATLLSDNASAPIFAVSPTDPNIVMLGYGFFTEGVLRSTDGGATFTNPIQGSVDALTFSAGGDVLYAARLNSTTEILRSSDKGATWSAMGSAGLPSAPGTVNYYPVVSTLLVHDENIVLAGFRHPDYQGVYRSIDRGATWTAATGLQGITVNEMVSVPFLADRKFAATSSGLYRSSDQGASWLHVTDPTASGVTTADLQSVAIDPVGTIYAGGAQHGEIFVSEDDGTSWERRDTGVLTNKINTLALRPGHSGELLAGTAHTLYRGTRFGQTWAVSANGIRASNISAVQNGSRLRVGLLDGGIYESLDGTNWTPLNNASLRSVLPGNKFSEIHSILETEHRLFATPNDGGIVSSTNLGTSWLAPPPSYPAVQISHLGGLLTLGGTTNVQLVGTNQGIYKTVNEGASWAWSGTGLPVTTIWSMTQKADGSAVYAGTFGQGVYKSTDGGASWSACNNGLTDLYIKALAYDDANDILVVGTNNGLFYTNDRGANYTALPNPWPNAQFSVDGIVVEDFVHGALYAAFQKKVFRSVDSGQTWDELYEGNPYSGSVIRITALVSDGPGVLYLGNFATGLDKYTVSPDITLSASSIPAGVYVVGTKLPYQFIVTNSGPHASTFTQAGFQVPVNIDVADLVTSRGTCAVSGSRRLSCDFGALGSGQSAIVTMGLVAAAGGTASLSLSAGSAEIDRDPSNNTGSLSGLRFVENVDLAATLTATPSSVNSGVTLEYTLVVSNAGTSPVTGASFETTFDARDQYTLTQGSATGCTGAVAGVQTCPLPTIAAGGSATWRWTVTPQWGGARVPSMVVRVDTQNSLDSNPANNSATATATVVPVTDLSATLAAPAARALQGSAFALTATVTNNSVIDAAGVTSTITLSDRLSFMSATGATCTAAGNVVGCNVGALGAGAARPITINVMATLPGAAASTASAASAGPDPNATNNSSTANVTVDPANDLAVTLTAPATATTGMTATLTLTANNLTTTEAQGVHVDLTLSSLMTYSSATGATCTSSATTVSCELGTIAGSGTKTVTLTVNSVTAGAASNTATISSPAADPVAANNSASASSTLSAPPPSSSSSSGGGKGGGALDVGTALLLTLLAALRRSRQFLSRIYRPLQRDVGDLESATEIADVLGHPLLGGGAIAIAQRGDELFLRIGDTRARLRYLVDHRSQRRDQ